METAEQRKKRTQNIIKDLAEKQSKTVCTLITKWPNWTMPGPNHRAAKCESSHTTFSAQEA